MQRLNQMINKGENRIIVDINLLRELYAERCSTLLSNAQEELMIFKVFLNNFIKNNRKH